MPRVYSECRERYPDGRCPHAQCERNLMIGVTDAGSLVLHRPMRPRLQRDERGGGRGGKGRITETIPERYPDGPDLDQALDALVSWWFDRDVPTCQSWWSENGSGNRGDAGLTLEQVGELQATTRERARQIEARGLRNARAVAEAMGLRPEPSRRRVVSGVTVRARVTMAQVSSPTTGDGEDRAAAPESDQDGDEFGVGDCGDDSGCAVGDAQPGETP